MWEWNNIFLSNQRVKEEIKGKLENTLRYRKINTTFQNLWDAVKVVLRGNFIDINDYIFKRPKNQLPDLLF